jgi:drug/metabolite transporter (DMT)-like permease
VDKRVKASLLALASGVCFGTIGLFSVNLLNANFNVYHILFWRFATAASILTIWLHYTDFRKLHFYWRPFLLGATIYFISTNCFFYSIKLVGSSLAMAIFFSFPALIVISNYIFKRHTVEKPEIWAVVILGIGVMLITDLDEFSFDMLGITLALVAAMLCSLYFIVAKKLVADLDSLVATLMITFGNSASFFLLNLYTWDFVVPSNLFEWSNVFAFATIGTIVPVVLLFKSLEEITEAQAAILSVFEPIVALLLGVILLDEDLSGWQITGAVFIILSGILTQVKHHKNLPI